MFDTFLQKVIKLRDRKVIFTSRNSESSGTVFNVFVIACLYACVCGANKPKVVLDT